MQNNDHTTDFSAEKTKKELIAAIEKAFAGVTLTDGIGLSEGDAIDDYASAKQIEKCKTSDERFDWKRIPVDDLNRYNVSLSYFDDLGLRFHLPAFLIADIKEEYRFNLDVELLDFTPKNDYKMQQARLLNAEQKQCVAKYLHYLKENDLIYDLFLFEEAILFWEG